MILTKDCVLYQIWCYQRNACPHDVGDTGFGPGSHSLLMLIRFLRLYSGRGSACGNPNAWEADTGGS